MFENIKDIDKDFLKEIDEVTKKKKEEFLSKLKTDMFEVAVKYPQLDCIFILGSTPEWNDGEECIHSTDVYLKNDEDYSECLEYFEYVYGWDEPAIPEEYVSANFKLTKKEITEIHALLRANVIAVIETLYKTNFNIVIDFTSGTPTIKASAYDRGY